MFTRKIINSYIYINLTIIITASISPSHPNITYIQTVIESLNYLIIDS